MKTIDKFIDRSPGAMTTATSTAPSTHRVRPPPAPTTSVPIPRANGARSAAADERVLAELLACSRRVPILAPPPRKRFRLPPPPPSAPPVAAQALLSGEPAAAAQAAAIIAAVDEAGACRVPGADDAREVRLGW
ncbi:hypothetical protein ACP70R_043827 [Stipagrostis hirtigluma subsp. patula]